MIYPDKMLIIGQVDRVNLLLSQMKLMSKNNKVFISNSTTDGLLLAQEISYKLIVEGISVENFMILPTTLINNYCRIFVLFGADEQLNHKLFDYFNELKSTYKVTNNCSIFQPTEDIANWILEDIRFIDRPKYKVEDIKVDVSNCLTPNGLLRTDCVPEGPYCYRNDKKCPYLYFSQNYDKQICGYCAFLNKSGWQDNGTFLLWDECKECNLNEYTEEYVKPNEVYLNE